MKVIVCILTDHPHSQKVSKLLSIFENDLFVINVYNLKPPNKDKKIKNKKSADKSVDKSVNKCDETEIFNYRLAWCLQDTAEKYKDDYLMIIQDDVICSTDTNSLSKIIKEIINYNTLKYNNNSITGSSVAGSIGSGSSGVKDDKGTIIYDQTLDNMVNKEWDVLYLSAWGDDCKKYNKVSEINDYNMYTASTSGPQGSSAFILTPGYRQRLIDNKLAKADNSLIILPTPFIADPFENKNINKMNLQRVKGDGLNGRLQHHEGVNYIKFIWFFGIVIFVAFFTWILIQFR